MSTSSPDDSTSPSPVAPNAPKFGTLIPNRIFVGGISPNTSEAELQSLFATYGRVKATKIILDRAGVSKGYGFVTFETEEEAKRIQKESEIILRDRKLNIAPAIKKQGMCHNLCDSGAVMTEALQSFALQMQQSPVDEDGLFYQQMAGSGDQQNTLIKPFARGYDSPTAIPNGTIMYQNGIPYTYHNGMAFFSVPDNYCTYSSPQANLPVIYPPSLYLPQQPFPCPAANAHYGSVSLPDLAHFVPAPVPTQYFIPADQNY